MLYETEMMFWSGEQLECLVRHLFHQSMMTRRTHRFQKGIGLLHKWERDSEPLCCTKWYSTVLKVITILGMYPQDLACISLRIGSQWTEKCLIKPCCKCFCPWGWSGSKNFWVKRKPNPLSLWTISFSFIFGGGNNSVVTPTWPHQKSHFPQGRVNLRRLVLQRSKDIWSAHVSDALVLVNITGAAT